MLKMNLIFIDAVFESQWKIFSFDVNENDPFFTCVKRTHEW